MLRYVAKYLGSIPPVFLDGALYFMIAVDGAFLATLSSDEAVKYIGAALLFWIKMILSSLNAGLLAIRMFRSTSYADHKEAKKLSGETVFFTNPSKQETTEPKV